MLLKSLQELGMGDVVAVFQILKGNHMFQPKFLHTRGPDMHMLELKALIYSKEKTHFLSGFKAE